MQLYTTRAFRKYLLSVFPQNSSLSLLLTNVIETKVEFANYKDEAQRVGHLFDTIIRSEQGQKWSMEQLQTSNLMRNFIRNFKCAGIQFLGVFGI